jgi:hypothetical protein
VSRKKQLEKRENEESYIALLGQMAINFQSVRWPEKSRNFMHLCIYDITKFHAFMFYFMTHKTTSLFFPMDKNK